MTVKDFIPVDDAKRTVEKVVRQKPTLKELTTVESPGRVVPTDSLDENAPRRQRRKAKTIKEPNSITQPKRDSILIITEKPQAAEKIAQALGSPVKKTENYVSYYSLTKDNEKILVASAVGHLFGLNYLKGQSGWPIFKIQWEPSFYKKKAEYTKRYYDLLKKLSKKAKEVVVATDYDIEGEVIGWNVLRFICGRENAKRMKYSTLTKDELEKAYEKPMAEMDWGQAYAGETRHILDWLYGINLSRALMQAIKTTGSFKILSIGRVQGPALKIIVDREKEIAEFKPEPYWQVFALVQGHEFKHPKDIFDKRELEKFEDIKEGIAETKESEQYLKPPVPFDLTSLQREAYAWHRISPSQTLSIAQNLYLNGLISYPRTSSQKIPDSINPKEILKKLSRRFPETKLAVRKKPIEGKKSDPAHPSIYPTGEFQNLKENEFKIYNLIVRRFISVFCLDALTKNRRVVIKAKEHLEIIFTSSGIKILDKGWTEVYPVKLEERDCPVLNGEVKIDEIKFAEKETQPPKRFTPASLITLLEKKNLGTKTTRSLIIDTLYNRGYLDGRSIQATPLGIKLIESLERYSPIIIDEELTRQLEQQIEKIQISKGDLKAKEDEIVRKAERLITDISKEFKAKEKEIGQGIAAGIEGLREIENANNLLNVCPVCKKGNLRIMYSRKTKRSFIGCSSYPECTQTYTLPPNSLIKKAERDCQFCGFPKLIAIRKGKRPWEFCFNPECEEVKRLREEWERKKKRWAKGKG